MDKNTIKNNQIILKISKEWAHMRLGNLKTETNIDFIIALLRKFQNDGIIEYELNLDDIKGQLKLMQDGSVRVDDRRLRQNLKTLMENIASVTAVYEDDDKIDVRTIFSRFKYDAKKQTLLIAWNEQNRSTIEEISKNALFMHRDFYKINSKYAKIMYIMLSEWNNAKTLSYRENGICSHTVSKSEFMHIFGIDKMASYTNNKYGVSNIMKRIIKPAIDELIPLGIFVNLQCTVQYQNTKKGREVSGYEFAWLPHDYVVDNKVKNALEMKKEGKTPQKQKKNKGIHFENERESGYYDELEKLLINT